jgi:Aminotransferase class-V
MVAGTYGARLHTHAVREFTTPLKYDDANNQVGTIQPIPEIGRVAHEHDIPFHMDAARLSEKSRPRSANSGWISCRCQGDLHKCVYRNGSRKAYAG